MYCVSTSETLLTPSASRFFPCPDCAASNRHRKHTDERPGHSPRHGFGRTVVKINVHTISASHEGIDEGIERQTRGCGVLGESDDTPLPLFFGQVISKADFIATVVNFDTDSLTNGVIKTVENVFKDAGDLTADAVNRASKACGPLYQVKQNT